jgi:hypothetical protein
MGFVAHTNPLNDEFVPSNRRNETEVGIRENSDLGRANLGRTRQNVGRTQTSTA